MNAGRDITMILSVALIFGGWCGDNGVATGQVPKAAASEKQESFQLHPPYTVDGQPVLGTYVVSTMDELKLVKDVGMNLILGGHEDLDARTPRGKFCLENNIKVMHHMTQHVYGKPRLGDAVTADATTIPLLGKGAGKIPESGVIQIEDELIHYARRKPTELIGCKRGHNGTTPAAHHGGIILFFPEACEAEVKHVKDSPNLWGYYVLDDSPGDALSALRAMYRAIRRVDNGPQRHPVCAGYGSAGSLCNFAPGVCDIMMIYWYPVSNSGYNRGMTSHEVQWMLTAARARVPGVPFIGIYQAFNGGTKKRAIPTAGQLREQIEDFVREGACGLVAFLCRGKEPLGGWAAHPHMQEVLRDVHGEIRKTGGLMVPPEPARMRQERIQPTGHWKKPRPIPGVVPAWHVIGPFDDAEKKILDAVFPPEKTVNLAGVYPGKWGPVRWVKRLSCGGVVGLGELVGPHTNDTVAYATCTVSSSLQKVQMRFGSDDDAIVWLNGKEVWRHDGMRGIGRDDDVISVTLPAGESQILVKVHNRAGMWAFFMRFTDGSGKPLEGLRFSPPEE
jgi:hypothetical protein